MTYLETLEASAQSARLVPMIEAALAQSGLTYKDLSTIACTVGPGSFTGLRVGLSSARAIGLAAGIPLLGFTTLEVLAYAASLLPSPLPAEEGRTFYSALALLNAGKGEFYYQLFSLDPFAAKSKPAVGPIENAKKLLSIDTAIVGFESEIISFPRADCLALLAASKFLSAQPATPFYIRPPDAKPMTI